MPYGIHKASHLRRSIYRHYLVPLGATHRTLLVEPDFKDLAAARNIVVMEVE